MSNDLGSAHGSVVINAASALATLAALRRSSAATVGALNTTGRAAILAGTGLVGVGAGIAAVFALAVNKSAEIEKKISYITSIIGLQGEEVDVVREKIIQLGQDSAYTASEVADGFTELAKAGATSEQLVGGVGDAMITLGQSADIGLDKAATALISITSTFGLAAKDAAHIADILQGAANSSIVSVEDMAVSFKYAGGVAANLGVSLEDTATAIAILGNAGIRGSTAGTSLRRIFLQLTPRTDKAAAAMKKLGIITKDGSNRFYDAEGNAKSLSQITEILRTSTAGLTAEMRQKAFATIFGDRAINSAIALSKGGATAFDAMYQKVGNVKAADIAAQRLDNLAGKWEILKGTIDSALIRSGAPAQKPLMEIVTLITRMVNAFNRLSPATQTMIVRMALVTAGLFLMLGGFLIVGGMILRTIAIMKQLANVYKILRIQIMLFIAVQRAANGAMLFNPITLIIVAIIALVAALIFAYKHSEKFRAIVDKIWASLKRTAIQVWNFLKAVPGAVASAWAATSAFFVNMYNAVAGFITSAINFIKNNWQSILLVILTGPLGLALVLFMTFKDKIIGFVTTLVTTVINWFMQLPGRIGYALGFIIGRAIQWYARMWVFMVTGAAKLVTAVISFFMKLPGRVWAFLLATIRFAINFARSLATNGTNAGRNFINAVINFFRTLPGRVWGFLSSTLGRIRTFVSNAVQAARDLVTRFRGAIVSGLQALPGLVTGALGRVISAFRGVIQQGFNAAKDFASGLWNGFKEGLFGSPRTKIEYAVEDMTDTVDREMKTFRGQVRTLQKLGNRLPSVDASYSTSALPAGSVPSPRSAPPSFGDAPREAPLIGVQKVYNPIEKPASQTASEKAAEAAELGAR